MLLSIRDLVKEYSSSVRANDGVALDVAEGEVFALLGPNGAGKSTLVKQIVGLAAPTSGSILIGGIDAVRHPRRAREAVSFQPQSNVPIDGLTPLQAIELVGQMRGGDRMTAHTRALDLVDALEIGEWAHRPGQTLSGGVRRLVGFCMAAVVPGRLIVLDEPTNDVDPLRRRLLWDRIRKLADGGVGVLLVTHNVLEVERAADRVAFMQAGRILAVGTPAALRESEADRLRLELTLAPGAATPSIPGDFRLATSGRRLLVTLPRARSVEALEWAEAQRSLGIAEEFSLSPASLEDTYLQMIGHDEADDAPAHDAELAVVA